jgi:hypothetical protein
MSLRKATARDAPCCSLGERDPSSAFYFGAHFIVRANSMKRVAEDHSFSAL